MSKKDLRLPALSLSTYHSNGTHHRRYLSLSDWLHSCDQIARHTWTITELQVWRLDTRGQSQVISRNEHGIVRSNRPPRS